MATPAVAAKSTIGLKDVRIAVLLTDTAEGTTYEEAQLLEGAIDVQISPQNTDPDIQYADDAEFDRVNLDPTCSVTMELTDLPLKIQEKLNGSTMDTKGVLVDKATDQPPYFAIGFRSEKADHKFRYVWLLKCIAKPVTETYHTKEGDSITRQTGKLEFDAIKRISDGEWRYRADEGLNGFTAATAATFLDAPYTPTYPSP